MKEWIRYYKANSGCWEGENLVYVCTIKDGNRIARGVSVCSLKDEPSDENGEFHARNYAKRGLKGRGNILIDTDGAILNLVKTDCPFNYHSDNDPRLTWQEKRFLYGSKKFLQEKHQHRIGRPYGSLPLPKNAVLSFKNVGVRNALKGE